MRLIDRMTKVGPFDDCNPIRKVGGTAKAALRQRRQDFLAYDPRAELNQTIPNHPPRHAPRFATRDRAELDKRMEKRRHVFGESPSEGVAFRFHMTMSTQLSEAHRGSQGVEAGRPCTRPELQGGRVQAKQLAAPLSARRAHEDLGDEARMG